jgi:hypothetical protein
MVLGECRSASESVDEAPSNEGRPVCIIIGLAATDRDEPDNPIWINHRRDASRLLGVGSQ